MKSNLLLKPIITEKSMQDAARGLFTFAVNIDANKAEIALAVNKTFNVKTEIVKTITFKGIAKRSGKRRSVFMSSPWKKALVKLPAGQKIELFDVTEQHAQKT